MAARDFRAYEHVELHLDPGVNIFIGPNASGKTSILEALGLLATGRSFRGASDIELVRGGCSAYLVRARLDGRLGSRIVEMRYAAPAGGVPGRRTVSLNGDQVPHAGDFLGLVPLVSFSPDDLALVKGGPAVRRRFLDSFLGQTSPAYREALTRYYRTLAQRNALLADMGSRRLAGGAAARLLEPWDETLVAEAGTVQEAREEACGILGPSAAAAFAEIDGGSLEVLYRPAVFNPGRREDELRRGVTLTGPHRDEVVLVADGRDSRRFASQGQQRSIVLALKLASVKRLEETLGESPVLLLDDVMSELDPGRRASLLPLLWRGQAFVTTTDRLGLERTLEDSRASGLDRESAAWFTVAETAVRKEETAP